MFHLLIKHVHGRSLEKPKWGEVYHLFINTLRLVTCYLIFLHFIFFFQNNWWNVSSNKGIQSHTEASWRRRYQTVCIWIIKVGQIPGYLLIMEPEPQSLPLPAPIVGDIVLIEEFAAATNQLNYVEESVAVTSDQIAATEHLTRGHRDNPHCKGCLTASNFRPILKCWGSTCPF